MTDNADPMEKLPAFAESVFESSLRNLPDQALSNSCHGDQPSSIAKILESHRTEARTWKRSGILARLLVVLITAVAASVMFLNVFPRIGLSEARLLGVLRLVIFFGSLATFVLLVLKLVLWILAMIRSENRATAGHRAGSFKPTAKERRLVLFLVVVPFVAFEGLTHAVPLTIGQLDLLFLYFLVGWALGFYTLRQSQKRRNRTQAELNAQAALRVNDGDYFLYLRSFVTSKRLLVRNKMPRVLDRLLVGPFWDVEFALAQACEALSPLVAIGGLGGGVGASKITVQDSNWKSLFAEMSSKARLIFVVPFATSGTLHEMKTLALDAALLRKTVWIMPPSYFSLRWPILFSSYRFHWARVRSALAKEGIHLPRYRRRGGLIILNRDGSLLKHIPTGDFAEDRLQSLFTSLLSTVEAQDDVQYAKKLSAIRLPKRPLWQKIKEWSFARVIGYRLSGFFSTATLSLLVIAAIVRTLLIQPFNIPSGSMTDTLLVNDYILVSKFDYGYTRYSIPFSPRLFAGRIFGREPNRGDVVVFRLPRDGTTDYVKRIIGMPGDRVQLKDGVIYINDVPVRRERASDYIGRNPCGGEGTAHVKRWKEMLPNGASYFTLKCIDNAFFDNTVVYQVPRGYYFVMGDNRDNSADSRVLSKVGYVPFENLIGRVRLIYFSILEGEKAVFVSRWPEAVRWNRIFKSVH